MILKILYLRSKFAKLNIEPVKRLLDKGIITNEEFKNYLWHSYPYYIDEIHEILSGFKNKIEVVKVEYGNLLFPYYEEFLETRDEAVYKEKMKSMIMVMMKNPLFSCLQRSEDEKQPILEKAIEELLIILDTNQEDVHQDYMVVIIRKLV